LYLFDTAMALSGLLARVPRADAATLRAIPAAVSFIERMIEAKSAVHPTPTAKEPRWSTTFGPHLLKVVLPLIAARGAEALEPVRRLSDALLPLHDGGRFTHGAVPGATYVHASCYAAEGLIGLAEFGWPGAGGLLAGCAEWLASIQLPAGGIPAWCEDESIRRPNFKAGTGATARIAHADVTAQATRIWVYVDAQRFCDSIDRALTFLAGLQHPSGGIRYREGNPCLNTWATVFTAQALDWAAAGRPLGRII
jgi:hypothetical protein